MSLVCEDSWQPPLCTTLFYTGSLFGNLIFGWIADKYEKKKQKKKNKQKTKKKKEKKANWLPSAPSS